MTADVTNFTTEENALHIHKTSMFYNVCCVYVLLALYQKKLIFGSISLNNSHVPFL